MPHAAPALPRRSPFFRQTGSMAVGRHIGGRGSRYEPENRDRNTQTADGVRRLVVGTFAGVFLLPLLN